MSIKWKCDICGAVRLDTCISVITKDMSKEYNLPEGTFKQNVKYCNDRKECIAGASTKKVGGLK